MKDCTERHGSKRLINVVKEKQCKAIYVVLITRFIQYCRYMFAVSRLLLACHFHSCSVTLLSSQKHFSFFFILVFLVTVLFLFLLCFVCFYRIFQLTGGLLLRCSAFDHSGSVHRFGQLNAQKQGGKGVCYILKIVFVFFLKFPWHKLSIKLK